MNEPEILVMDPMSRKDLRRQYRRERREDSPFRWPEAVKAVNWKLWLALWVSVVWLILVRA